MMSLVLWENRNVTHQGKVWFNTIMTIQTLALALNFVEAFKDMAKVFRWRVLASRPSTPREVDLILGGESLMKLCRLMFESLRPLKPITVLVCASWILLNLLAQATIAMLSLNYSMDSGTNSSGILTRHGNVSAASLDCFGKGTNNSCPDSLGASMITAHSYGELISNRAPCNYTDDSDILKANQSCFYFMNNNGPEYAYRYVEYNPDDTASAYPYLTNRTIKASADQCYQYDVDLKSPLINTPDGPKDTQVFSFSNETYTGHLPIPRMEGAFNSTTYVYNGAKIPQSATLVACGDRCLTMYAYRLNNGRSAHIFSCQISIDNVANASEDWHQISDANARLAIASIALTGRDTHPKGIIAWQQYQLYTWGSYWEVNDLTAPEVGGYMAQFAIGSLANMADTNVLQTKPGTLPILGYHLDNNWNYIIALVLCIGIAHCVLVIAILWSARKIIVLDDSDLSTARLLHNLTSRLGGSGSLLDGKRLAEELQRKLREDKQTSHINNDKQSDENAQLLYGINKRNADESTGEMVLDLAADIPVRQKLKGGMFPRGIYA